MAVNRVDYGGNTLIDLTADTVTAATLLQGHTAHGKDGEMIIGAFNPEGENLSPTPWKEIEVGTITPDTATSQLVTDPSKGTPMGLILSLINTNGVSVSSSMSHWQIWINDSK